VSGCAVRLCAHLTRHGRGSTWRIASRSRARFRCRRGVTLPPGSRGGLVNLPYEVQTGYPLPVAPNLLEHSVQAWLDLLHPEQRLEVVGLTYCTVDARGQGTDGGLPRIWGVARLRPDRRLHVRVLAAGEASRFPWDYRYAEQPEGRLYRVVGPPRGPSLDLDLLGPGWGDERLSASLGDRLRACGWTGPFRYSPPNEPSQVESVGAPRRWQISSAALVGLDRSGRRL
jgi:hypothetical protein